MKIAILGWGSLLWETHPEFDLWHSFWEYDGPTLKIEFSRVSESRNNALTLVIDPVNGVEVTVAWCLSQRTTLTDAIRDLMSREGTKPDCIGSIIVNHNENLWEHYVFEKEIIEWAAPKDLDAVIWTALPSNFQEKTNQSFSVDNALSYLKSLPIKDKEKAEEYIKKAPQFVQTPLRNAFQQEGPIKN